MPFTKPTTGTTGWDVNLNQVIDRASDLDTNCYFPLSAYGAHSATAPVETAQSGSDLTSWQVRLWVPSNQAITKVIVPLWGAGVVGSGGLNAVAIYNDAGSTLLGQTASATSLWTTLGWSSANLTASIAAATTGRFVRAVINIEGLTTAPKCAYAVVINNDTIGYVLNGASGPRRSATKSAYSGSFPSTIDPSALGNPTSFIPLLMLG